MKCNAKTEKEMREHDVPWPKTIEELNEYIQSLIDMEHDYGTSAYSMSLAAVAAFNFIAGVVGASGFQASCADLDILRRTRRIKGPFKIVNYEDMLYPQYEDKFCFQIIGKDVWEWLQKEAAENISDADIEYSEYLLKLDQYKKDIAKFVEKYPDYYDRRKHYDPLGYGTGKEWKAEEKKRAGGFEFAPQEPYCHVNNKSPVYLHWESIVQGILPFKCTLEKKHD